MGTFKNPYHNGKTFFDVQFMHVCLKPYCLVEHTHEWKIIVQNWWIVVIELLGLLKAKQINTKEIDFGWWLVSIQFKEQMY